MSSCHFSLAKAEYYPQNFRVEAPEPLPESLITPRRMGQISSAQPICRSLSAVNGQAR